MFQSISINIVLLLRKSLLLNPMVCGSNESSVEMSELLRDNGFFVLPVRYPTVPKNEARIRFSLNASIPIEDYGCLFEFLECLVCE